MPNQQKQVVSVREAARRLGRGKATVEQMLREGALPFGTAYHRKVGGEFIYIIPEKALERYLAGEINSNACPHCGEDISK